MELVTILVIVFALVLVYFLGSTLVSLILELWSYLRKNREKFLEKQLTDRLGEDAAKAIIGHSMVSGDCGGRVSNISSKVFGYVACQQMDKDSKHVLQAASEAYATTTQSPASGTDTTAKTTAEQNTSTDASTTDSTSENAAESQVAASTKVATDPEALANWYEDFSAEMTSGYKNSLRIPSLLVAAIVVVLLNLDTLKIVSTIWDNPNDTKELAQTLKSVDWKSLGQEPDLTDSASMNQRIDDVLLVLSKLDTLDDDGLPIGWKSAEQLGLVLPASDTSMEIHFKKLMAVKNDTSSGTSDTTYSFAYSPPQGADRYQPQGKVAEQEPLLEAVFGSAIPRPNPELQENDGVLKLNFSNVFGPRGLDSLRAQLNGISADSTYSFSVVAHQEEVRPNVFQVVAANLRTVTYETFLGWLISILAIGMGSSFWYDVLKRIASWLAKAS